MAFFGSDCCSILAGLWAFSVNEVIDQTFFFLFPILIKNTVNQLIVQMHQEKKIYPKKRPERPILKKYQNAQFLLEWGKVATLMVDTGPTFVYLILDLRYLLSLVEGLARLTRCDV